MKSRKKYRKRRKISMVNRAKELPQEIIHHILSFLPTEEAVHTSLLSKAWLRAWSTNPSLNFDDKRFCQKICMKNPQLDRYHPEIIQKLFVPFVENTLARHRKHGLGIDKFELNLYHRGTASLVDKWLRIVVAKAVKKLVVYSLATDTLFCTMPQTIFAADSLTVLEVCGFEIFDFKLCDHGRVLKNLKWLYLGATVVEDSTIRRLGSVFPSIEELILENCHGLQIIEISNLPKLTKFWVVSCMSVKTVDISKAHNLRSFAFKNLHQHKLFLALFPPTSLKCLNLRGLILTDMVFHNLISQCPFLSDLTVNDCCDLERINVSSRTLECLIFISNDWTLRDVEIDAPKLTVLKYIGVAVPSFSSKRSSGDLESYVEITPFHLIDTDFFIKLRKLQGQISPYQISLTINSDCREVSIDFKELRKAALLIDPKPKLENLRLSISSSSIPYSSLLDGLLWSFCPHNLTIDCTKFNLPVYYLCSELMYPGHRNCCGSNEEIRCWRHDLNCLFFKEDTGNSLLQLSRFDWFDEADVFDSNSEVCLCLHWSND